MIKTDKPAIDLARVEAGAKMFVAWTVEGVGSLSQSGVADQNGKSIVCAKEHIVEDFVVNTDISVIPFFSNFTPEVPPLYSYSQCHLPEASVSLFVFFVCASGRLRSRNIHFLM